MVAARSLLVAVAVTAVVMLTIPVAQAHATLVTTDPADGAAVANEPSKVSLTFNQNIGTPAYVVVKAPDGSKLEKGDPKVVDETVTQRVEHAGIAGEYTMSYRVVSADGHPISGTVTYTVESGRALTAEEAGSQTSEESGSFVHRHRTHLLWGLGGLVVAGALLLWPRRRDDA